MKDKYKSNKMEEKIERKLGTLIFQGTILFLSISFGLFTFGIVSDKLSISDIVGFVFFIIFIVVSGLGSLIACFFGIKNNKMILIYTAGFLFILMVALLTYSYAQVYLDNISQKVLINISQNN